VSLTSRTAAVGAADVAGGADGAPVVAAGMQFLLQLHLYLRSRWLCFRATFIIHQ